jgi:polyferredoxin
LFYTVLMSGILIAFVWTLAHRIPLRVDVIRDRQTLSQETAAGNIENLYRLQIINMDDKRHSYRISAKGIDGLKIVRGDHIEIAPLGTANLSVALEATRMALNKPTQPITFIIAAEDDVRIARESKSSFLK